MKVICIDNKDGSYKVASLLLKEGKEYNVSQSKDYKNGYYVDGIKYNPITGKIILFNKNRFIPLSEIDETEMKREYNTVTKK